MFIDAHKEKDVRTLLQKANSLFNLVPIAGPDRSGTFWRIHLIPHLSCLVLHSMEAALQTQALPPTWCCSLKRVLQHPDQSRSVFLTHPTGYSCLSFISLFWWSFISTPKGKSDPKSSCLLRDGDWRGAWLHSAPSSGEGLSCPHKLKAIHKSVCFVSMKVQHKAFRHQLNLDIAVFIVMNNKSFSPALQQQGIIQQKFNF